MADSEKLTDFLLEIDPLSAAVTVGLIEDAIAVLKRHPLMGRNGRQVDRDLRELVISRGKTGYVASYSIEIEQDAVLILGIRHQRDAGYFWHLLEKIKFLHTICLHILTRSDREHHSFCQ